MSSEWIIVAAAAIVIALGSSQMIGGAAIELGDQTANSMSAIPTFGAPAAGTEAATITETVDR